MPVPEQGRHAGHLVERGRCVECDVYLTRTDILAAPCPNCKAVPGRRCRRKHPGQGSHIERLWAAHGHTPGEIARLHAEFMASPEGRRRRRSQGKR